MAGGTKGGDSVTRGQGLGSPAEPEATEGDIVVTGDAADDADADADDVCVCVTFPSLLSLRSLSCWTQTEAN